MKYLKSYFVLCCIVLLVQANMVAQAAEQSIQSPTPDEVLTMLKNGNERFYTGKSIHPHAYAARIEKAGKTNQAEFAYATIITCSDSRVPAELIFDAGVMDVFVVRV
ncbi:MAG: hypothetical protein PF692_03200 [Kiritimatiellae bacterium]|nr:hypothetical protein [Kiritimatiellia bacterium]